ncbi:MAG: alpha/beta fold hydrolase [Burkholderiales bacterium]|nr:alpha/beta fold hydrolase [Burkholderiales bacterium]MBH2020467.1 alpha/beta fold hydrolase [Burkholderiales bacterium]
MNFPLTINQSAEVQGLLQSATRLETPCGGGDLAWHVWGQAARNPALAPLVLLHGGSGSWTHWLRNIKALAESGRWVLVPDLPGFGDSAAPLHGTDADAIPEPLALGLQVLLGDRACDLVGFSFGGMAAGFVAAQFPQRVAQLVLVGAPGLGIAPEKAIRLNAWRHLLEPAQRDAVHRGNLAALMLLHPESITETALRLHVDNVLRDRMRGRSLSRTDALAQALLKVKCPVHAIYGAEDALYRGKMQALEPVLRLAPGFRALTLIEGAGHWVQFERAEAFNQALLATLNAAL